MISCGLLGARVCVQVLCIQKNAAFCVCVVEPTKFSMGQTWPYSMGQTWPYRMGQTWP